MESLNKDVENDKSKTTIPTIESIRLRQGSNEKIFDEFSSFQEYKKFMYNEVKKEVKFKSDARKWSLIILAIISLLLFINIFVMIYLNGSTICKISFPKFKTEVVMAMITATFVNLFTIVTLVFKYIFSPTKDLMEHAKDVANGD